MIALSVVIAVAAGASLAGGMPESMAASTVSVDQQVRETEAVGNLPTGDLESLYAAHALEEPLSELPCSEVPPTTATIESIYEDYLNAKEQQAYDILLPQLEDVAAGRSSSTTFTISAWTLFGNMSWTAEELGVEFVYDDRTGTWGAGVQDALREKMQEVVNLLDVQTSLMDDYPYLFYWIDKSANYGFSWSYDASGNGNQYEAYIAGDLTLRFPVSPSYRSTSGDHYSVKSDVGTQIETSVSTAQEIADMYRHLPPLERLRAYKEAICELVDYNHDAASWSVEHIAEYTSDPWQLIWVFDGDDSTKVVCEGYAKALKYLCDLSGRTDIECRIIGGYLDDTNGGHMWNVVRMDDGNSYLIDVTNCDSGTTGAPELLFVQPPLSGSVGDWYTFRTSGGSTTRYKYDADTLRYHSEGFLTLATTAYSVPAEHPLSDATITLEYQQTEYDGTDKCPSVTVDYCGLVLEEGVDYSVSYTDNHTAGMATAHVTPLGSYYTGSGSAQFSITRRSVTVTANAALKVYGDADPAFSATADGLVEGDSLSYSFARATGEDVGGYAIRPLGPTTQGNYSVTYASGTLTIVPRPISSSEVLFATIPDQEWTGEALEPSVSGFFGTEALVLGTDYTVSYSDNTNVGIATATISGQGNFSGETSVQFNIVSRSVDIPEGGTFTYDGTQKTGVTAPEGCGYALSGDVTATDAGSYEAVATLSDASLRWEDGTTAPKTIGWSISPASVEFSVTVGNQVYAGVPLEPVPTVTSVPEGVPFSVTSYADNVAVGTATVTVGSASPNYSGSGSTTFSIGKRPVTISVDDASKEYGEDDPEFSAQVTGALASEPVAYAFERDPGDNVGEYQIRAVPVGGENPNYEISTEPGTLTISPATASVTIADIDDVTYSGQQQRPVPDVTTVPSGLPYVVTYGENVHAGQGSVSVSLGANYSGSATKAFTILPKPVTLSVDDQEKTYGQAAPTLTASIDGLVGTDAVGYSLTWAGDESSDVGDYDITALVTPNPDYDVTVKKGTMHVIPAPATFTVADITGLVYDGTEQRPVPDVTSVPAGATYSVAWSNNVNAGNSAVVIVTANGNYSGGTTKTFSIGRRPATIKADDKEKAYGEADPSLTATVSGTVRDEVLDYSLVRGGNETVGNHPISVSLGDNPNYDITTTPGTLTIFAARASISIAPIPAQMYCGSEIEPELEVTTEPEGVEYDVKYSSNVHAGAAATVTVMAKGSYTGEATRTFTISKRPATVVAEDASKPYGAEDPSLSAHVAGVLDGDEVTYSLSRAPGESVGTYAITAVPDEHPDYQIVAVPATFEITLADVELSLGTIPDLVYDGTEQDPELTVGGPDGLEYEVAYSGHRDAGTWEVTVTAKSPYRGTTQGTFRILPKPVTLAVDDKTKVIMADDPELTATVTGLVDGDTLDFELSCEKEERIGSYPIVATLGTNPNYDVTVTDGMLTIVPISATLTISPVAAQVYSGQAQEPEVVVTTVPAGIPYAVTYENNTDAGMATVKAVATGNYAGLAEASFRINPRPAVVAAQDLSKAYGDPDPTLAAAVTGIVPGESIDYSLSRAAGEDVGTYAISVSLGSNPNYAVSAQGASLTIVPATVTFEVGAIPTQTYDGTACEPQPAIAATPLGTTYSVSYGNNVHAGTATMTVTAYGNYTGSVTKEFEIGKRPATVKADDKSRTVDEADPALTATVTGAVDGEEILYGLSREEGTAVGQYAIHVALGENPDYDVTSTDGTFSITKAPATISIGEIPAQTYSGSPIEPQVTVTTNPDGIEYEVLYSDNTNAGTATVTVTAKGDHTGSATRTFTINRKAATISVDDKSKTYGEDDPELTATVTGTVTGESLSYDLSRTPGEDVGTYAISATLRRSSNSNYDITIEPGTLTIGAASVTFEIGDIDSQVYDGTQHRPLPTITPSADDVAYDVTYGENKDAGPGATITVTAKGNHTGSKTKEFTIGKRPATVKADDKSKPFGADDPALTVTVTGVVSGDELAYSLARESGEALGTYPIRVTLGSNPNYEVDATDGTLRIVKATTTFAIAPIPDQTYTGSPVTPTVSVTPTPSQATYEVAYSNNTNAGEGTATVTVTATGDYVGTETAHFTIKRKSVTVKADDTSKVYGEDDPELTATVTGAVDGKPVSYSPTRDTGEDVGTYAIRISLGNNPNYDVTTEDGTLTVTPAPATISIADIPNQSYVGHAIEPQVTVTSEPSGIAYDVSYSGNTNAGTATVTVTAKGNHAGTASKTFQIAKAHATVTADNKEKVYGQDDPALTATVSGTFGQDTIGFSLSRDTGVDVGEYAIRVTPEANANYEVTVANGTLTIVPANPNLVISEIAPQTYTGSPIEPAVTVTSTPAGITPQISYSDNTNAGTATVTASVSGGNYKGSTSKTFTIKRKPVTVQAHDASKEYGQDDPTFSASVSGTISGDALEYELVHNDGEDAGQHAIKVVMGSGTSPNYEVVPTDGTLTITPMPVTFDIDDIADQIYAGSGIEPEVTVTSQPSGIQFVVRYSENRNAGVATLTVSPASGNYSGTATKTFNIGRRSVTVKVDDKTKFLGDPDPEFTATQSWTSGDGERVAFKAVREKGETLGEYEVTAVADDDDNPNYDVTFLPGKLTIVEAPPVEAATGGQAEDGGQTGGQGNQQPSTDSRQDGAGGGTKGNGTSSAGSSQASSAGSKSTGKGAGGSSAGGALQQTGDAIAIAAAGAAVASAGAAIAVRRRRRSA